MPLARVEALHEEELCKALARELVDLLAVGVHLVGDEQRLQAARLRDGLEEGVARQVLLGQRLLAAAFGLGLGLGLGSGLGLGLGLGLGFGLGLGVRASPTPKAPPLKP